jgi:hypothetical protein
MIGVTLEREVKGCLGLPLENLIDATMMREGDLAAITAEIEGA